MKITGAMLRHQAFLAGRSVRAIVRDPGLGAEAGRLLATRGRSTLSLRLPWLPFRLIDQLESLVGPGTNVFEYGGGGSTLWFLDRGATVVTVEHDEMWVEHLRSGWSGEHWTLLHRSLEGEGAAYVVSIEDYADESFDVVLVDGRERTRCASAAAVKVRPGGMMIVDDAERQRYAPAIAALQRQGWARTDWVGFAPAKPTLAYTAVLTKPLLHG